MIKVGREFNVKWVKRWFDMCDFISQWSKDPSSKYGCVIVDDRNTVLSLGWNGLPRGLLDDRRERDERPIKYQWYEHAERNAVYNAASKGIALLGTILFVNGISCADCARAIIQSGISVVHMKNKFIPSYKDSQELALSMLEEANVEVYLHEE